MIKRRLEKAPLYVLAIYASIFIFLIYTCAYAFRKPFTAAIYNDEFYWGFDVKILYVLSEIIGYALSKFIGIRVLSSMKPEQRSFYIIGLMGISEIALLGFALFPVPLKILSIFFSGLPLGMIWGIIFSYIEGRRISEALNVGLSIALIISSGLVKTLAQFTMDNLHIPEYWMPVTTGAICFPVMLICTYMLNQIPAPSELDIRLRTKRAPMDKYERRKFLRKFFWGICMLIVFYGSLTVFRELRDSFAADIWKEMRIEGAFIFTQTEIPIAFFVLLMMFMIVFISNNRLALNLIYSISIIGSCIMIFSTLLFLNGYLSPILWMICSGLGMYMGYIPFTYLLERLIASLKVVSTAVFVIYLADSFGYLGTTIVFLVKNFAHLELSWTSMLTNTAIIKGLISLVTIIVVYRYFHHQLNSLTILPKQ